MSRTPRQTPGGLIYHVINRAITGTRLYDRPEDYRAFERVLEETMKLLPMRLLAYCVMPNHWHFVFWPERDGQLPKFMHQLTNTHVKRWQTYRGTVGRGHLYQGRYRSFPVGEDEHLFRVLRYVERNALRANLVRQAELWHWSSLWRRCKGGLHTTLLSDWPMEVPEDWIQLVNTPLTEKEMEAVRMCVQRGMPYGEQAWVERVVSLLGLESTLRQRGRPSKG